MGYAPLKLIEGDRPLLTFLARYPGDDVYPLVTGSPTVAFVFKADEYATDGSGTTLACTITDGPNGVFTVQTTTPITATAGRYFYKAIVTQGGNPLTVRHGPLVVENA